MKTLSPETLAQLDGPAIKTRGAVVFYLASGTHGFWDGTGTISPVDLPGVELKSGGQMIQAVMGSDKLADEAQPFTVSLSENKEYGITPGILATIENENYRNRLVVFYVLRLVVDTQALLPVDVARRGLISHVVHSVDDEGRHMATAHCETLAIDDSRATGSVANHAQQQQISAGDMFFEFASAAGNVSIAFGRAFEDS